MFENSMWPFAFVCCLLLSSAASDSIGTCQPDDFHYEYTQCDSDGMRWRVSVPQHGKCTGGAPNAPVEGKDCKFTCKAGQFLDIQGQQECLSCPAGTYSLGGGVRFDDWDDLPLGFSVNSEGFGGAYHWMGARNEDNNCNKSTWQPRGMYIAAQPGDCTTSLIFSTKLVKSGVVTFEYQFNNPDTLFHFTVQNDQCQAADDESKGTWPRNTEEGKWRSVTLSLKSGMNVLQWRAIGMSGHSSTRNPILIRKIEVTGVAYTSECTKCRSGSYSSSGSEFCTLCKENSYSDRGAEQCSPCNADTEYAPMGASKCETRPPCSERDYYEFQTPCDDNKQTRKKYDWITPQICNPNAAGAVTLPQDGAPESCPPCNPGMQLFNNSCQFCPTNQYSDGSNPCKSCPASTSPEYSLDYRWWNVMPPNMTSSCLSMTAENCSPQAGWLLANDHLRTHFSHDKDVYLILNLKLPGFRAHENVVNGKKEVISHVSFMFEINCTDECELVFLSDENGKNTISKAWKGSHPKTEFIYDVRSNKPMVVTWAFQPYNWENVDIEDTEKMLNNVAKIYSVKVTNTLAGGATGCKPCPRGTTKNTCIPCPAGQYIDSDTTSCKSCPPNTVVSSNDAWGKKACKACGEGLKADGNACKSDCKFMAPSGKEYDFSELKNLQFVMGNKLFTSSGTQYYHGFNISLCSTKDGQMPACYNNVTDEPSEKRAELEQLTGGLFGQPQSVSGMVCRSTLVPQRDEKTPVVATQPVSLGDHLIKIESNDSSIGRNYTEAGFPFTTEDLEHDIHFYYKSEQSTPACPEGRTSIISMRCDVKQDMQGSILLPPKCSDGTCDGCTFHFLWRSQHACPICRDEDYEVINGECIQGEQIIHYYPPKHCLLVNSNKPKQMKQKCTTLPFALQVALPVIGGMGMLLMILLIYLYKRNKRLEYKYMKLVETAGGRDGELPGVESCGLEDDDEETVHFSDRNISLFQKLKDKISSSSSKDDDNPFVAVKMQEKLPLT